MRYNYILILLFLACQTSSAQTKVDSALGDNYLLSIEENYLSSNSTLFNFELRNAQYQSVQKIDSKKKHINWMFYEIIDYNTDGYKDLMLKKELNSGQIIIEYWIFDMNSGKLKLHKELNKNANLYSAHDWVYNQQDHKFTGTIKAGNFYAEERIFKLKKRELKNIRNNKKSSETKHDKYRTIVTKGKSVDTSYTKGDSYNPIGLDWDFTDTLQEEFEGYTILILGHTDEFIGIDVSNTDLKIHDAFMPGPILTRLKFYDLERRSSHEPIVQMMDLNFDGFLDLIVPVSYNESFACIYNPKDGKFYVHLELGYIQDIHIDKNARSFWIETNSPPCGTGGYMIDSLEFTYNEGFVLKSFTRFTNSWIYESPSPKARKNIFRRKSKGLETLNISRKYILENGSFKLNNQRTLRTTMDY